MIIPKPNPKGKPMHKTGIPYLDMTWNPGGCGCSKGCPACWAREKVAHRVGTNIGCDACRDFKVHLHRERLTGPQAPAHRQKPTTIGAQFTGELFDEARLMVETVEILCAVMNAPQHAFIFLTQRPERMAEAFSMIPDDVPDPDKHTRRDNWYCGITARDQNQLDAGMDALAGLPHKIWISGEPMEGPLNIERHADRIAGVIVGCNNRKDQPATATNWIYKLSGQCHAAGVSFFLKQTRNMINDRLITNPAHFPMGLRTRELPWPYNGHPAGHDHYKTGDKNLRHAEPTL